MTHHVWTTGDGSGTEVAPTPPRRSNPPGGRAAASRAVQSQSVFISRGPSPSNGLAANNRLRANTSAAAATAVVVAAGSSSSSSSRVGGGGGAGIAANTSKPTRPARPLPPSGLASPQQRSDASTVVRRARPSMVPPEHRGGVVQPLRKKNRIPRPGSMSVKINTPPPLTSR